MHKYYNVDVLVNHELKHKETDAASSVTRFRASTEHRYRKPASVHLAATLVRAHCRQLTKFTRNCLSSYTTASSADTRHVFEVCERLVTSRERNTAHQYESNQCWFPSLLCRPYVHEVSMNVTLYRRRSAT
jgi:hypothetical protein